RDSGDHGGSCRLAFLAWFRLGAKGDGSGTRMALECLCGCRHSAGCRARLAPGEAVLKVRSELIELVAGFAIWAVGFVVLYALQALGCVYGWPWHRVLLVFAYAVCLVPLAMLALRQRNVSTPS